MERRKIVAVIGSGSTTKGNEDYQLAERIGRILVDMGFRVLTGGLNGIMEAAMKGARSSTRYSEGDTIAILPGIDPEDSNEYADIVIPTGIGIGRNIIVTNADGVIAVGGGSGTLSEMAFAWQKGRSIAAMDVDGWSKELGGRTLAPGGQEIFKTDDPEVAVRWMATRLTETVID